MDDILADKQAITEVLLSYCRGLDRMDRELAETVWHPDGTADYGDFHGTGAEFLDYVWKAHAAVRAHTHRVSNFFIEVDGDRAASETYIVATLWGEGNPPGMPSMVTQFVANGRYIDQWSRRDGRWAIDHRVFVEDFSVTSGVDGTPKTAPGAAPGKRDSSDPSYLALGRLPG